MKKWSAGKDIEGREIRIPGSENENEMNDAKKLF
jgi:hypothetical protein